MKFFSICVGIAIALQTMALSAVQWSDPSQTYPNLNLIPWPKSLELHDGKMRLGPHLRVVATEPKLRPLAVIVADELDRAAGLKAEVASGESRPGDIVLAIDRTLKADEPIHAIRDRRLADTTDGAYTLVVADRASVTGFDYRAAAEGTATLLQAISRDAEGLYLPALAVKDWPRADYCGAMLDVGRQYHPIESIKQLIELCRLYKIRYLHLHMTDDQGFTFPSTAYPQLGRQNVGAHGGEAPRVYKLEELKDAVAYGDARGVTLVPEFEMPGHSWAARRCMPEAFCAVHPKTGKPVDIGCMCIANEKLYPVLDTLIGEMCDVFHSSPYFHIGTDECETNGLPAHAGFKAFLAKHGLKNEDAVCSYFINAVNAMIAKRGKKTIKWEGVGDGACKDVICMCWVGNNRTAERLVQNGFTVITCPWNFGVPWPEWSMYVCNGSMLKPSDPVLGATTVMWEQSPAMHLASARRGLAERQERTWGPDNRFTEEGFARRWNGADALAARLAGLSEPKMPAAVLSSLPGVGLVDAVRAFDNPQSSWQIDGGTMTWFESCRPPVANDHVLVMFHHARAIYELSVATGRDGRGRISQGELRTSADGQTFKTVAQFHDGAARAVVEDATVKAVQILCTAAQSDNLIVDDVGMRLMRRISGTVNDIHGLGDGNYAVCAADAIIPNVGQCGVNFVNKGHVLTLGTGGGNAATLTGVLSGSGTVEFQAGPRNGGFRDSPLTLAGDRPNTLAGTYFIQQGRIVLGKSDGTAALAGRIVVGGRGSNDGLFWTANEQIDDRASVELIESVYGGAYLDLNGHSEKFSSLTMAAHTRIVAGGGILRLGHLTVEGRDVPSGIYTGGESWCQGSGMVLVGDVSQRDIAGTIAAPDGPPGVLRLTAPTAVQLAADCGDVFRTEGFTLALNADHRKAIRLTGFITGNGNLEITAGDATSPSGGPLQLAGSQANSYRGATHLVHGVLRLAKPAGVMAVPGDLVFGGDADANRGDAVDLAADQQIGDNATITAAGNQPCFLNLNGHRQSVLRLVLSGAAKVRTGDGGLLRAKLVSVAGQPIAPGEYTAAAGWIEGSGKVIVDPLTDVSGNVEPLAPGLIARLTGDTQFGWGALAFDVETNGHTVHFDSGNGNADTIAGSISGTGDVKFTMGPYHTGFRDAPMILAGSQPNTASGTYYAAKGRVQLQKPAGVDAIAGNVVVGGQGYNDCLHWENDEQINDLAKITLIESPSTGAAYLDLNGFTETVAALAMTPNNKVKTDSSSGRSGTLKVRMLTIGGVQQPPGTYTAARASWLEGQGKVIVQP